jgi:hypothetical protein
MLREKFGFSDDEDVDEVDIDEDIGHADEINSKSFNK